MSSTRRWFVYNGAPGGQLNSLNYFYYSGFEPICSLGSSICAVYALEMFGGGSPWPQNFSPNIQRYIADAIAYASPQPSWPQSYVLVKF